MAEILKVKPDLIVDILYIQEVIFEYKVEKSAGYKKDYLDQELGEMVVDFITCPCCKGIMRDAIISRGKITCKECSTNSLSMNPVEQVRNCVSNLKIKCPLLRECDWRGKLCEAEKHLQECGNCRILCPLECGTVIQRCEYIHHIDVQCELGRVNCMYCGQECFRKSLSRHLELCLELPVKCDCEEEFSLPEYASHIDTECPLSLMECPYAKYTCNVGSIFRKDLLAHKNEYYIEHQDMMEEEQGRIKKQMNSIVVELNVKRDMEKIEWKISDISSIENELYGPTFKTGASRFRLMLHRIGPLCIGIKKLGRSVLSDPQATSFQLCLTSVKELVEMYHAETSIANRDVGQTMYPLFNLTEQILSEYVHPDNSLVIKICFKVIDLREFRCLELNNTI
ncbi:TNF receptor-associated factor 4 [Oopsacas minuta]|uniref:TNF receptor-associated factor 4 n=1 Tax=Oopsacas minuta TaxID=111878 RepID=A0AAV7KAU2_9METZ|nr:TNF receptor-associated factor 4 [Oopsacas minuta]